MPGSRCPLAQTPFSLPTLLRPLPPHCLSSRSRASVLSCTPRKACTSPSSRPKSSGRQRPSSLRSAGTCRWEAPSVQSQLEQRQPSQHLHQGLLVTEGRPHLAPHTFQ